MRRLKTAVAAAAILAGSGFAANAQMNITAHTGAQGGMYMETVVVWADIWNNALKNVHVSPILGSGVGNAIKVNEDTKGEMMGVVGTPDAVYAAAGTGPFEKRAPDGLKDIRTLFRYNVVSYFMVLARGDAVPDGVTTFKELLDKKPKLRWVFHERGNVGQVVADQALKGYGVSVQDLQKWGGSTTFISHTAMSEQIINGQADVAFAATRQPAAWVLDMDASVKNLKWLTLDAKVLDKIAKDSGGGLIRAVEPVGPYKTQPGPYDSIGNDHLLIVNKSMDEKTAYDMVKLALTNAKRIGDAVTAMKSFDPKSVCKDVGPWPLHPGAERACKETGNL